MDRKDAYFLIPVHLAWREYLHFIWTSLTPVVTWSHKNIIRFQRWCLALLLQVYQLQELHINWEKFDLLPSMRTMDLLMDANTKTALVHPRNDRIRRLSFLMQKYHCCLCLCLRCHLEVSSLVSSLSSSFIGSYLPKARDFEVNRYISWRMGTHLLKLEAKHHLLRVLRL